MSKKIKLRTYYWQGKNKNGDLLKGEQDALHIALLKSDLHKRGITPIKIGKKNNLIFLRRKIDSEDIRIFSRQITTMLVAGIPFIKSLELIERGSHKETMRLLIVNIKKNIESGSSIAKALSQHPKLFNALFCNLVTAGEQSGTLEVMFERITTYQEKLHLLKNKIKKALFYPAAIIMVAIFVTIALLVLVVPQFEVLFSGFGASLPATTLMIINFSHFLQQHGWVICVFLAMIIIALGLLWHRSQKFSETIGQYLLRLPLIGIILKKSAIARFARTLATLFAAGLPLTDALLMVAGTTGNRIYNQLALHIRNQLINGQTLQHALQTTNSFPTIVVQMIAIGEASGTLEAMLNKVANIFEEDIDYCVTNLTNLLEPLIMIILGLLIGGLVIAMYLPIFKLGSVV